MPTCTATKEKGISVMAQPKKLRTDTGRDGKVLPDGHQVTIDEINRMIISSLETSSLRIGGFLLDTVFSGDPERVLSRNRRKAAGIKRASCKPRMLDRAAQVSRFRRLKRP
jgi:hypothetical protein